MPQHALAADVRKLTGADGLSIEIYDHGCVRRIDHGATTVNLFIPNAVEAGPTNLYLRWHRPAGEPDFVRLLGPSSPTRGRRVAQNRWVGVGNWQGIRYAIALQLSHRRACWFWHIHLDNTGEKSARLDVIYAQDVALAPYGTVRMNEYYVSQYVDHTPLEHPVHGWIVGSRQNLASAARHPWCMLGSLRQSAAFATDALQVHGLASRAGLAPAGIAAGLPSARLQHEHSMVALQDDAVEVAAGASASFGFYGWVAADHPAATSAADVALAGEALKLPEATYVPVESELRVDPHTAGSGLNLFTTAPLLSVSKPDPVMLRSWFPGAWRHKETADDGSILSFFHGQDRHVVLRDKELRVQRPHGHLLRTGCAAVPDESALTSTVWMAGVFNSMLTQGHVSINRLLSTVHSYLSLFRSHGQRVFVDMGQGWQLLDVPAAFEISPTLCRWIYVHAQGVLEVRSEARSDPHEVRLQIEVLSGPPLRCLIAHHLALTGDDGSATQPVLWSHNAGVIELRPAAGTELQRRFPHGCFQIVAASGTRFEQVGADELLFQDGHSRMQSYLCVVTSSGASAELHIRGRLLSDEPVPQSMMWQEADRVPTLECGSSRTQSVQLARLSEVLPWYTHNALIHYLAPRGLEQYSGGGWGTRDVTQGPVELLLALDHLAPIRDLLVRVMAAQNADGDWPQWFMFFERERAIRANDSHGDIVFWPLLALAQYLLASGDASVLDETVPFFHPDAAAAESGTVWQHVLRALGVIAGRVIAGTHLVAYGHGDWNDSLQPADPSMREHLCSAWTVTLHYQVLVTMARALRAAGRTDAAVGMESQAQAIRADFQRLLIVDGVLTGYAFFDDPPQIRCLLHPRDATTGVHYSSLAMIHAVLEGLFTPEQARTHLELIRTQLSGPDGARLFDRPMAYRGGPQRFFQRAESASFFGREIGLMYMHAHLRYAQALAHVGDATAFLHALCQANPIGLREIVPNATLRQANCYYSSSDAAFADRYQASQHYDAVARGAIAVDGGWRVYSSGAGIALSLIVRRFLGITAEFDALLLDPVIPAELDGLEARVHVYGRRLLVRYTINGAGYGLTGLEVNGQPVKFAREPNPYRIGAARVAKADLEALLRPDQNLVAVTLGLTG